MQLAWAVSPSHLQVLAREPDGPGPHYPRIQPELPVYDLLGESTILLHYLDQPTVFVGFGIPQNLSFLILWYQTVITRLTKKKKFKKIKIK